MSKFKYRAMTANGKKIEGSYDATDRDEVISMITSNGYYPLLIEEVQSGFNIKFKFKDKITAKDISIFCRQLYTMIDAGVSISRALFIISGQITNKKFKSIVIKIEDDIKKGEMLSASMAKHKSVFPPILISMVQSGEISGTLGTMMLRMAVHFEKEFKLNNKIKSASTYPTILGIVAVLAVMVIMIFVMPTFMEMFQSEGVELPITTKILLATSNFMQHNLLVLIVIGIILYASFNYYKKTDHGIEAISALKLKLPIIGELTKKIIVSRFTRTMATLCSSSVTFVQALPIVAGVMGNKVAEMAIIKVREEIVKGENLSSAVREVKIFPEMLASMINIGEETGSLDEILNKTADFYDDEVEQAITKATTMIEPLLIIVMGSIIGVIVISIMMPMFDMYGKM